MTRATHVSRRQLLAASAGAPLIMGAGAMPTAVGGVVQSVARDLARYINFGTKQSGGAGDEGCGTWLESELSASGFATERQRFSVPWFETEKSELSVDGASATVWPEPIVNATDAHGLVGPLVRVDSTGNWEGSLNGAIALVDLPFGRWSSMFWRQVKNPVDMAFAGGARACVIVTNGPSGKVIALNTDGRKPLYPGSLAVLAPDDATPFFAAASRRGEACLTILGKGGRRPAFNLIGRLDRGQGKWVVVSTPRSGWFTCAGERGGGIATWLLIARWASRALPDHNLAFVCNSGHEYQYLGAEELIERAAPSPQKTDFWLHLGANLASRDWHDTVGPLKPLPGIDSQRFLVVSPQLMSLARTEFAGLPGLEAPYSSDDMSAGELSNIIAAGYRRVAGVFGVHRFHHVVQDGAECVSAEAVTATALAFRNLLKKAVR